MCHRCVGWYSVTEITSRVLPSTGTEVGLEQRLAASWTLRTKWLFCTGSLDYFFLALRSSSVMVFRLNANSFSAVFYVAIFIYNTHFQFIPTVNFSIECRLILKLILCVCVCVCVCICVYRRLLSVALPRILFCSRWVYSPPHRDITLVLFGKARLY